MQVLHLILCEEMTQLQAKTSAFFQFLGHNVPINCSKLLGVRKRNEALVHSFTYRYHTCFYVQNRESYKVIKILTQIRIQIQNSF